MTARVREINFDGLVGPTHHYAGLAIGNLASQRSGQQTSNPRAAALQGLTKMRRLYDLGIAQAVIPPQDRPDCAALRRVGFSGTDAQVLQQAHREEPSLLSAASSASSMWTANAATLSPGFDTADGRMHITPANLTSHLHRAWETPQTAVLLKSIFADEALFAHHQPLQPTPMLSDEGAANHMRLGLQHNQHALEVFVFGGRTSVYPPRQSEAASRAIARLHQLDPARTVLIAQNPHAIDKGVFHNDVIAVANEHVLLYHAQAFTDSSVVTQQLSRTFQKACGGELILIEVPATRITLDEAVATYFFNSQLVTLDDGSMALICPVECQEHPRALAVLQGIVSDDNPIRQFHFVDTRQSMQNGGGPACLRLRVVLSAAQLQVVHPGILFTPSLHTQLQGWVNKHYRDQLHPDDLGDPNLLEESRAALDALTALLGLGAIYPFQKSGLF